MCTITEIQLKVLDEEIIFFTLEHFQAYAIIFSSFSSCRYRLELINSFLALHLCNNNLGSGWLGLFEQKANKTD